jgi:hypothetical protein
MKKIIILVMCLILPVCVFAAPGSKIETGNIMDTSVDSGTIVSVGGGEFKNKAGGKGIGEGLDVKIGSVEKTETNVGSVVIKDEDGGVKTGGIYDHTTNKSAVINIGSEVNDGAVTIEGGSSAQ